MYIQKRSTPVFAAREFSIPSPPPIPTPPPDPFSDDNSQSSTGSSSSSSKSSQSNSKSSSSPSATSSPGSSSTAVLSNSVGGSSIIGASPSNIASPSTTNNSSGAVSSSKSGLSGGVIGAIVASAVVAIVAAIFLVRYCYARKRKAQRAKSPILGWDNQADSKTVQEKAAEVPKPRDSLSITLSERSETASQYSRWSYRASQAGTVNRTSVAETENRSSWFNSLYGSYQGGSKTPPPVPPMPPLSVVVPAIDPAKNGQITSPSSELSTPMFAVPRVTEAGVPYTLATVQRPFIQTMPDELPARAGQQVGILQQFDDGWTLCVALVGNSTGPQGMVPTECLKRSSTISSAAASSVAGAEIKPSSRFSKRKSSLFA